MTAYCTKEDIQGLGSEFTIPSTWSDDNITTLIAEITAELNAMTDIDFSESQSLDVVIDGSGWSVLQLKKETKLPIISITNVYERDDIEDVFETSGDTWDTDEYTYKVGDHRLEALDGVWTAGIRNFQISGVFGYSSVPVNIKRATVLLSRERIQTGYLNSFDISSEAWLDYKISYRKTKNDIPSVTGFSIIDRLLHPYLKGTGVLLNRL